MDEIKSQYQGPVVIAQDLMVINVTPEQIVTRMSYSDMLAWTVPAEKEEALDFSPMPVEGRTPEWLIESQFK